MLPTYNGRLLIQLSRPTADLYIKTDASTVTVFTGTHTSTANIPNIITNNRHSQAPRECFAILLALTLWSPQWAESELLVYCLEPSHLQVLVHGRSRDEAILSIARHIWLITAQQDIIITPLLHTTMDYQLRVTVPAPASVLGLPDVLP